MGSDAYVVMNLLLLLAMKRPFRIEKLTMTTTRMVADMSSLSKYAAIEEESSAIKILTRLIMPV